MVAIDEVVVEVAVAVVEVVVADAGDIVDDIVDGIEGIGAPKAAAEIGLLSSSMVGMETMDDTRFLFAITLIPLVK
jgi:hypothetical protein